MDTVQALSSLGSLALIVGVIVGLLQLRGLSTQRQEEMVIRVFSPSFDEGFIRAFWKVQSWGRETFESFDARAAIDDWTALDQVATFFEMMGVLYKRGHAKLDLLDDLMAGYLLMTWNQLAPIIRGYRVKANVPDYGRRFELLARALDQRLTARGEAHAAVDDSEPSGSAGEVHV